MQHMGKRAAPLWTSLCAGAALFVLFAAIGMPFNPAEAVSAARVSSPFRYTFNSAGMLAEAGSMSETSSPYFWLNSGAYLPIKNGIGSTVIGALPSDDYWRQLYARTNPLDTGNGYYPQNLFRLVTRSTWGDVEERVSFKILKTNLTDTPNRDCYSGVLLFGRYKDGDNLYYLGLRHDGSATIKKKINGTYYTLASAQIFGSKGEYDRWNNPNLIPENQWMGMKARFDNLANGSVKITLYLDRYNNGIWKEILTATDSGTGGGVLSPGSGGIRSDYMDVQFDDFEIRNI